MHEFLTVPKVAKILGCHPDTVRLMCDQGRLPGAFRLGGAGSQWRIPRSSVDALITSTRPTVRGRKSA
jgi:excisionase family DNA binding protein